MSGRVSRPWGVGRYPGIVPRRIADAEGNITDVYPVSVHLNTNEHFCALDSYLTILRASTIHLFYTIAIT